MFYTTVLLNDLFAVHRSMEVSMQLDDSFRLPFDDSGGALFGQIIAGKQPLNAPVSEAADMIGEEGVSVFGNLQQRTRKFLEQQEDDNNTNNLVNNDSLQQQTPKTAQQSQTGNAYESTTQQVDGTTTNLINNNSLQQAANAVQMSQTGNTSVALMIQSSSGLTGSVPYKSAA